MILNYMGFINSTRVDKCVMHLSLVLNGEDDTSVTVAAKTDATYHRVVCD